MLPKDEKVRQELVGTMCAKPTEIFLSWSAEMHFPEFWTIFVI